MNRMNFQHVQHVQHLALLAQAITYGVQLVGNIGGISGSDFAIKDETVKLEPRRAPPWLAMGGLAGDCDPNSGCFHG